MLSLVERALARFFSRVFAIMLRSFINPAILTESNEDMSKKIIWKAGILRIHELSFSVQPPFILDPLLGIIEYFLCQVAA